MIIYDGVPDPTHFELMVNACDRDGAVWAIARDGDPLAVMLGYDDYMRMADVANEAHLRGLA